jgi:hypothetical protein
VSAQSAGKLAPLERRWDIDWLHVLVTLLTIMVGSFAIATAPYDLAVKQTNVTCFLFEMRLLREKTSQASTAHPVGLMADGDIEGARRCRTKCGVG